jgi:hypothetical protein
MAAQLNTTGEERDSAITAPDPSTQHEDDEHHHTEHLDDATRSEIVTVKIIQ